ncbi:MAG: hypothetical protein QM765_46540 [Myxococcales bacterium]
MGFRPLQLLGPLAVAALLVAGCPEEPDLTEPIAPALEAGKDKSPVTPLPGAGAAKAKPKLTLPAELAAALHGIEWEVIDAPPASELAYQVPADCKLEYLDLGTLAITEENFSVKHRYFQSFVLEKSGPKTMARTPGRRLEYVKFSSYLRSVDGFVDPSAWRQPKVTLTVAPDHVEMPSVLSPVFQLQQGTSYGLASPFNGWPPIPSQGSPEPEWKYHLLFDTPKTLQKQPPAKVELHGWVRLGFQRAAYLTATWAENAEPVPIGTALSHLRVQGQSPLRSTLAQDREITGHYLISEQGYLALAHLEGMARIHNSFTMRRGRSGRTMEREVFEDRSFSFTTKLVSDCSGSLFWKTPAKDLPEAQALALVEEFTNLVAADRIGDAVEMLSPAIRYAFPGDVLVLLLRGHFKSLGAHDFGKKVVAESKEAKASEEDRERDRGQGLEFEGTTRKGRKTYSTVVAEQLGERRYITFVGTSSRPDRKSWDLLLVRPGGMYSGTLPLFKPRY